MLGRGFFNRFKNPAFFRFALMAALLGMAFSGAACKSMEKAVAGPVEADAFVHIKKITYVTEEGRTIVKVYGSRKFEFTSYKLADPLRLAVEMPNAALDFEPKRIPVDDKIISGMSVVPFSKVNSVRLELELHLDAQYKVTQKQDHLEVALASAHTSAGGVAPKPADMSKARDESGELDRLRAENERLKSESLAARKAAVTLEEENNKMKKDIEDLRNQIGESNRQLEDASALSRTLQARIAFMEEQLAEIQSKVYGAERSDGIFSQKASGPALDVNAAPSVQLPAPIVAPPAESGETDDGKDGALANTGSPKTDMEINMTVAAWVKAWKNKDVERYASFYAPDFRTKDMGIAEWIADKKAKFSSNRSFKISVENMKITPNSDGSVTVVFTQRYKTGNYRDKGLKQLILINESGRWLIVSEEWSPL